MKTAITMFLLKTHAVTNKKMSQDKIREKFVDDMLQSHKTVLQEAWVKWEDLVDKDIEAMHKGADSELDVKYPHGFYSFAISHLDQLIAENKGVNEPEPEPVQVKKVVKKSKKSKK